MQVGQRQLVKVTGLRELAAMKRVCTLAFRAPFVACAFREGSHGLDVKRGVTSLTERKYVVFDRSFVAKAAPQMTSLVNAGGEYLHPLETRSTLSKSIDSGCSPEEPL